MLVTGINLINTYPYTMTLYSICQIKVPSYFVPFFKGFYHYLIYWRRSVKGTGHRLYIGGFTEPSPALEYGLHYAIYNFFQSCGRYGRFYGVSARSSLTGCTFWTAQLQHKPIEWPQGNGKIKKKKNLK